MHRSTHGVCSSAAAALARLCTQGQNGIRRLVSRACSISQRLLSKQRICNGRSRSIDLSLEKAKAGQSSADSQDNFGTADCPLEKVPVRQEPGGVEQECLGHVLLALVRPGREGRCGIGQDCPVRSRHASHDLAQQLVIDGRPRQRRTKPGGRAWQLIGKRSRPQLLVELFALVLHAVLCNGGCQSQEPHIASVCPQHICPPEHKPQSTTEHPGLLGGNCGLHLLPQLSPLGLRLRSAFFQLCVSNVLDESRE